MPDAAEPSTADQERPTARVAEPPSVPSAVRVEPTPPPPDEAPPLVTSPAAPRARGSSWLAVLAGVVAAAVALAVGELVSAFGAAGQSLVGNVGNEVIDRAGGSLIRFAISSLGTNDKPALVIGIVVVSLAIGGAVGWRASTRPWVGFAGFAAFGLVGAVCGVRDPQASAGVAVLAAALAAAAGVLALRVLLRILRTGSAFSGAPPAPAAGRTRSGRAESMVTPHRSRREFFTWAGAMGAFAGAVAYGARSLASRSEVDAARALIDLPTPKNTPPTAPSGSTLENLSTYVTPNDRFYKIDTSLIAPQVDPAGWSMEINGMVDRPFRLTFDELLALPQVEEMVTLSCVSNEVGGSLVGNASWQGVPLRDLLERAGVQPGATQIVGTSVDGWTGGFPTEVAFDGRTALVAVGMNGEPLPVDHGFPARLVVSGLYGYVSATKWLREIRLTTWEGFDGYWIDKGWSKTGPVKTQSRIDVPTSSADLVAGRTPIAGVAWAPSRGISRVEVAIDDEWHDANLFDTVSDNTWRQWVYEWDATPGRHVIRVRATDGTGATQTDQLAAPDPDGATGWHSRTVFVS